MQTVNYVDGYIMNDFSSTITCSIVPSLSVGKSIIIYTALANTTYIKNITVSIGTGMYGTGQIVDFYLLFSADVWVQDLSSSYLSAPNSSISVQYSQLAYLTLTGNTNVVKF